MTAALLNRLRLALRGEPPAVNLVAQDLGKCEDCCGENGPD
jgi:hypothetical protein